MEASILNGVVLVSKLVLTNAILDFPWYLFSSSVVLGIYAPSMRYPKYSASSFSIRWCNLARIYNLLYSRKDGRSEEGIFDAGNDGSVFLRFGFLLLPLWVGDEFCPL